MQNFATKIPLYLILKLILEWISLFCFSLSSMQLNGENPQEDLAFKGDMMFLENSPNYKTMAKYCPKLISFVEKWWRFLKIMGN